MTQEKNRQFYTLGLGILTAVVVFMVGSALIGSWEKPQAQGQLNLYESDLLLQASDWHPPESSQPSLPNVWGQRQPIESALKQYQKVQTSVQDSLDGQSPQASTSAQFLDQLEIRLGLLYAEAGEVETAIATWQHLVAAPHAPDSAAPTQATAEVLLGLWHSSDPVVAPTAKDQLQSHLSGWFRTHALTQLFTVTQASEALAQLEADTQTQSQQVLQRLLFIQGLPVLGSVVGVIILIAWLLSTLWPQRSTPAPQRPERSDDAETPTPDLAEAPPAEIASDEPWQHIVRWPLTTVWQVMVVWFTAFFGVSLVVPVVLVVLGLNPESLDARAQALVALGNYSVLAIVGLAVIYFSLKPYAERPLKLLPWRWQGRWPLWGISGYLAALPLVILISLINQKLLQDQGGGNPLLEIILHSKDGLSMVLLWAMVALLAPIFEETLFRGFFLTSLTRYLPMWGAIGLSALVFAIAHLNVSDILPLTVLGCVLGIVYTRSRNLLASMLVHGLWNSGSFIGLLVLGSSAN